MKKLRVINEKISYTYNLTSSMNSGKKERKNDER